MHTKPQGAAPNFGSNRNSHGRAIRRSAFKATEYVGSRGRRVLDVHPSAELIEETRVRRQIIWPWTGLTQDNISPGQKRHVCYEHGLLRGQVNDLGNSRNSDNVDDGKILTNGRRRH